MTDIFSPAKRSDVMSRLRSRGNARTEGALVREFRELGIVGWRRQVKIRLAASTRNGSGTGKTGSSRAGAVRPDFVFPRLKLAVFVDGCFWHACPRHATRPRQNAAFWRRKLAANQTRDRQVTRALRRAAWRVLRNWEHSLVREQSARLTTRLRRVFASAGIAVSEARPSPRRSPRRRPER
jgi:DNA mismatch endonuclease (patch repair protein)